MKLFITGISTDVGKTITAAILTESLLADYWKPIQAGDLENADTHKVRRLVSNEISVFHPNSYALKTPASPHYSAKIEQVEIQLNQIIEPETKNHLIIEGAGGLLVPINATQTIADLIQPDYQVVLVSRHYLGSINHTLLTAEALKSRNISVAGIVFSGEENPDSEQIILEKTQLPLIGKINQEPYFDANVVSEYAGIFRESLQKLNR